LFSFAACCGRDITLVEGTKQGKSAGLCKGWSLGVLFIERRQKRWFQTRAVAESIDFVSNAGFGKCDFEVLSRGLRIWQF